MKKHCSAPWIATLVVSCLSGLTCAETVPLHNRDLTATLARQLKELELWIDQCQSMRWIQSNPDPIKEVDAQLGKIVQALDGTIYYSKKAAADIDVHYNNLLDEYTKKRLNLEELKSALELQQKYISIANAAFDILSITDWYRSAMTDPNLLKNMGRSDPIILKFEDLNRIDLVIEGALGAYSRLDSAAELTSNGSARWGKLQPWDEELKECGLTLLEIKSLASDSKNIAVAFGEANLLQQAMLAGKVPMNLEQMASLREAGFSSLVQLIGKIGVQVAKIQRRDLLDRAKELDSVIAAEGKPLQVAGIEKERIHARWMAAESLLQRARSVRTKFLSLRYRLSGNVDFVRVPPVDQNLSWGDGLRGYKLQFEAMGESILQSMRAVNARPAPKGTIRILNPVVKQGESIVVEFTAPAEYSRTAWIGLVPTDTPHGSEAIADKVDLGYVYVSNRTSGRIKLLPPANGGRYDVRFFDDDYLGFEVASSTVTVLDKE